MYKALILNLSSLGLSLNGLNFALIFCLNFALKTISLEHFDQFFVLISTLQEKMLRPVGGLYDPPFKIRKFVMQ